MPGKLIPIQSAAERAAWREQKAKDSDSGSRKPVPVSTDGKLPLEERESIAATLEMHPNAVHVLARRHGIGTGHVVAVFVEESLRRKRKAVAMAYQAGRRDGAFPPTPAQGKRAA